MLEEKRERFNKLNKLRKKAKIVNYSALYGVGAAKLSREMGVSRGEAQQLLDSFWKLNWAIKEVAERQITKVVGGYTWIYNPVSGFWYELRYTKDTWSTLNQGTGVYLFDSWLARAKPKGFMGNAQFHDETLGFSQKGRRDATTRMLKGAIQQLNKDIELNVIMDIDVKFGETYADVH